MISQHDTVFPNGSTPDGQRLHNGSPLKSGPRPARPRHPGSSGRRRRRPPHPFPPPLPLHTRSVNPRKAPTTRYSHSGATGLQRHLAAEQNASAAFASACREHGIRRSVGRVGFSFDNALTESFFVSITGEPRHVRTVVGQSRRGPIPAYWSAAPTGNPGLWTRAFDRVGSTSTLGKPARLGPACRLHSTTLSTSGADAW